MEELLRFDKEKEFVWLDFETESLCLYFEKNLPWQIGMLKTRGDEIVDSYKAYIKWDRPPNVSKGAALITKFDPLNIEKFGIDYREVVQKTVDWTSKCLFLAGQNILAFDLYFLNGFYKIAGKSSINLAEKIIDTHALAKGIKMGITFDPRKSSLLEYQYQMIHTIAKGVKTNLTTLGHEYNVEHNYDGLHDALSDIQLNFKIWNKIKYQVDI